VKASGILAALLLLAMASAKAETVDIVVMTSDDPGLPWVQHLEETYIPAVNAALAGTNVEVRWETRLGDGSLDIGGELDALTNGFAQVAPLPALPHSWALYMHNISIATPFVCDRPELVAPAIDHLNAAFPALTRAWASFGVHYLGGSFAHNRFVLASSVPVESIDDLSRQTVAANYLFLDWFAGTQMLGLPGDQETYRSGFETQTTMAAVMTASMADRLAIEDLAPFIVDPGLGSVWGGGLATNRAWFVSQRVELRNALCIGAKAYGEAMALEMANLADLSLDNLATRGAEVSAFTSEETARWALSMHDVAADWAFEIDIRDMPGRSMLAMWVAELNDTCGAPPRIWKAPILGE
jgi:hypothetical protein